MTTERKQIPDWLLERVALGELPGEELDGLRRQIASDEEARRRLEVLEASNAEILAEYPPGAMLEDIERRQRMAKVADSVGAGQRRRRALSGFALGAALAGAAAVVMFSLPYDGDVGPDLPPEQIILKGDPQLVVYRIDGAKQERLESGAAAGTGDLLQVSYRAAEAIYGVILSVDGRGTVTVHFPDQPMAARLNPSGLVSLDHSYELDDAPAFERFFFVTGRRPFAVEGIERAASAAAPALVEHLGSEVELRLPVGLAQTTLLIEKRETP